MSTSQTIRSVLTHLDADKLILFCYDHFPKLYATFEPLRYSQPILVALILDHATATNQLSRLAQWLGLPDEKKKKGKKKKPDVSIRIGDISGDFSGNIAGGNINQ